MRPRVFPAEDSARCGRASRVAVASMRPRVFPAEDGVAPGRPLATFPSFNEAAGIPRGRLAQHVAPVAPSLASMRPRVFPAEDTRKLDKQMGDRAASMRPRVFPAEDCGSIRSVCARSAGFNEAAGIPRGRPSRRAGRPGCAAGFNEAAGIPRGRPTCDRQCWSPGCASMRPRVFPAEDAPGCPRGARQAGRFNEAAGIPRGRQDGETLTLDLVRELQ